MQAGIARHPAKREVHFSACQRASGSWYAGLSAALDQGVDGETHLSRWQANRLKPYHIIYQPGGRVIRVLDNVKYFFFFIASRVLAGGHILTHSELKAHGLYG